MNEKYLKQYRDQLEKVWVEHEKADTFEAEQKVTGRYQLLIQEIQAVLNENNVNITQVTPCEGGGYIHYDYQFKSPLANGQYKWGKAVYGPADVDTFRGLAAALAIVAQAVNYQRLRIEDPQDKGRYRQF